MTGMQYQAYKTALNWYVDNGVDTPLSDEALDRTVLVDETQPPAITLEEPIAPMASVPTASQVSVLGASDARQEAVKLALEAQTLDELKQAISEFEGIALKKTATNLVFSEGNPKAHVMVVGEAPGAEEDRLGKPFVGESGQLLDKILAAINLSRAEEDPDKACYIANILNWRPPGNRTPSPGEVEASMPFIERHIQLVQPKILIFAGGVSAKALLGSEKGISRLRNKWQDYTPQTSEYQKEAKPIPAMATYHPAYLLRTPAQKKAVWEDVQMVQERLQEIIS